jgi:hypothetical protein
MSKGQNDKECPSLPQGKLTIDDAIKNRSWQINKKEKLIN